MKIAKKPGQDNPKVADGLQNVPPSVTGNDLPEGLRESIKEKIEAFLKPGLEAAGSFARFLSMIKNAADRDTLLDYAMEVVYLGTPEHRAALELFLLSLRSGDLKPSDEPVTLIRSAIARYEGQKQETPKRGRS